MKQFARTALGASMMMLLVACTANKGDFGGNVVTPPVIQKKKAPTLQDVSSQPRTQEQLDALQQPALGFEAPLLERNIHPNSTEDNEVVAFKAEDIQPIADDIHAVNQRKISELYRSKRTRSSHAIEGIHEHFNGFFASRNRDYMQFVKSGWIANTESNPDYDYDKLRAFGGMQGSVFYVGNNPAKALPSSGQVHYKGTWDFVTDAKKTRKPSEAFTAEGKFRTGGNYSAFSFHESVIGDATLREKESGAKDPVTHSSEFTVDFDKKTVNGKLKYNNGSAITKDRYTIDAKLSGNRFRGSATATDATDAYFGASSKTLEGGFYGDKAQELAGKFLADDNSLFAVFGARQYKNGSFNDIADAQTNFDAVKLSYENFELTQMDTFGDATKLVVNGRSFDLLPAQAAKDFVAHSSQALKEGNQLVMNACCSNLDYLKFGNYFTQAGDKQSDAYLFLTGERTPLAQMLTSGQYEYQGTWEANVLTTGQKVGGVTPNKDKSGSRAIFGVDFDKKTLKGALYQNNANTPSIHINNGIIEGNGFSGTFQSRASGFLLDSATGDSAHVSGSVTGGFYGPKAVELGGYFNSNAGDKDKINGVFGAKQQVLK